MNRLTGIISAVSSCDSVHVIDTIVADIRCTSTLTGDCAHDHWQPGQAVTLAFRELEVSLAKNLSGQISIRNRLPCLVTSICHGEAFTRVGLSLGKQSLHSVITRQSARLLELAEGDQVEALIKATSVMLLAEAEK
jgi:molybdate transport system regulatory protein